METKNVAWEDFMDEKSIEINELPQDLRDKIAQYDECYDEYMELDDEDSMILELEVKLTALDDGICNDLENYLSKREQIRAEQQSQQQSQGQDGVQNGDSKTNDSMTNDSNTNDTNKTDSNNASNDSFGDGGKTSSSKPTWRFW